MKKVWPVSNWHGGVMGKAVVFEAEGGLIHGWATSAFRLVPEWKKGLSRVKKVKASSLCRGGVVVKAVVLKA